MAEDKFYILCDFVNEDSIDLADKEKSTPMEVAYSSWLVFPEGKRRKSVQELIDDKDEMRLKWPSNSNVLCKEKMKTTGVIWTEAVAVILAHSDDWTEIIGARKSMMEFGHPFPTRSMRKQLVQRRNQVEADKKGNDKSKLCSAERGNKRYEDVPSRRKNLEKTFPAGSSNAERSDNLNDDVGSKKVKGHKKTEPKSDPPSEESDYLSEENSSAESDGRVDRNKQGPSKSNNLSRKTAKYSSKENFPVYEGDSSSESSDTEAYSKPQLKLENERLRNNIKQLRTELDALRVTKFFLETDFPALRDQFKKLMKDMESFRGAFSEISGSGVQKKAKSSISHHRTPPLFTPDKIRTTPSSISAGSSSKSLIGVNSAVAGSSKVMPSTKNNDFEAFFEPLKDIPEPNLGSSSESTRSVTGSEGDVIPETSEPKSRTEAAQHPRAHTPVRPAVNEPSNEQPAFLISNKKGSSRRKEGARPEPVFDPKEEFKFGGKTLNGVDLNRCTHSGSMKILASDLFVRLFTKEEMATGNLTARLPNGHKNTTIVPKKKLDPERIEGIIDYMTNFVKGAMTRADIEKVAKEAIAAKVNNYCRHPEAKALQAEYMKTLTHRPDAGEEAPPPPQL